jgi:photosystem II stability/assembly factor-like uncharacterized protein
MQSRFPIRYALASAALIHIVALSAVSSTRAETLAELAQHTHYHGIAFARSGSAELLLASHHGVFALDKDGTATRVSPVQDFMGFSPDPAQAMSYYASGHPAAGGNSGFLHSADGGATWKQLSPGADGPVDFHQMDVSPADPKAIYGSYGQIQISRDGGSTWAVAGNPPVDLIAIAASSLKTHRVYAATQNGLHVSDDAGASWRLLAFENEVVSTVKTAPGNVLYAFVLGRGLVKAMEDNPKEWTSLSNDLGDAIPLHLASDEKDSKHLALTTQKNDVLESHDGGKTWRPFGSTAE